jgi:hypothetical protein
MIASQRTTHQVSLAEFFNASDESGEELYETPQIDPTVDLNINVCVGKNGDRYHSIRLVADGTVVSQCPHHHYGTITLREAAALWSIPCEVCEPVDWRAPEGDT